MTGILLTQYNGSILGPIAKVLGVIINAIFNLLDKAGLPNIGLSIIIFTVIIYLLLLPLTFKQQKFAKMNAVMAPEIKAVQDKYKDKKDQESMQKQNEELQAVYKKYGVSPTGSCVQLLIQMPVLLALYRVIYNMPAYVGKLYETLEPLASQILSNNGSSIVQELNTSTTAFAKSDFSKVETIIDVLTRASSSEWTQIKENIPAVATMLDSVHAQFLTYYKFGWINIADTPSFIIKNGWGDKDYRVIIGALLIPILAAASQWLNVLFMPQPANDDKDNPMNASMKSMNVMMPIMSAIFCFTLPAGMGIYWIASACVRCVQQVFINKYFDRVGLDKIIEDNMKKAAAKAEKEKKKFNSEDLKAKADVINKKNLKNIESKAAAIDENRTYKKGSLTEKANLVKKLNK